MNILFVGDIFGTVGKRVLAEHLEKIRAEFAIDLCIANGENIAGGRGVTSNLVRKLYKFGVDIVTGGNHSMADTEVYSDLYASRSLIRPLNLPVHKPGKGQIIHTLADGRKVAVINLMGRTFIPDETLGDPFTIGAEAVSWAKSQTPIVIVDFHAEATSEKICLAHHLDGKATAVLGTHTHVQTADERILPKGSAFITDVGMTGPELSAIGMKHEPIIRRYITQEHIRFEPSSEGPMLNAVVLDINDTTGRASSIKRILRRYPYLV